MKQWTLSLAREDAPALAPLRLTPGLEVAEDGSTIWLRGHSSDEQLSRALKNLPVRERFEWVTADRLRPIYSRLPTVAVPDLAWRPIAEWIQVQLPAGALPGELGAKIRLRLVRSPQERRPNVLLTDFATWKEFALTAPEIRLRRLRFAVSSGRETVIWGVPLPPLPGRLFVEEEGVAVAAGFGWWPQVSPEVLRHVFQAGEDALVVWDQEGMVRRLHAEQLVAASRGAVRATAAGLETTHEGRSF